jgi:hypothetical protein
MVTGAVAMAELAHIVAAVSITVALRGRDEFRDIGSFPYSPR